MNIYRVFEGKIWPVPCSNLDSLAWRLRYYGHTVVGIPEDLVNAASVLDAYRDLIEMPDARRRARLIRELRRGPE